MQHLHFYLYTWRFYSSTLSTENHQLALSGKSIYTESQTEIKGGVKQGWLPHKSTPLNLRIWSEVLCTAAHSCTLRKELWNPLLLQSHMTFMYLQRNIVVGLGGAVELWSLYIDANFPELLMSPLMESVGYVLTKEVNDFLLRVYKCTRYT